LIIPDATPGAGAVSVTVEPDSDPYRLEENTYYMFAGTPAILYVDDDNGASTETIFEQAILDAGYYSITHNFAAAGSPTAATMGSFDVVIWSTGEDWHTATSASYTHFDEQYGASTTVPKRIVVINGQTEHEVAGLQNFDSYTTVFTYTGAVDTLTLGMNTGGYEGNYYTWYDYVSVVPL